MARFVMLDGARGMDMPDGRSLRGDRHHGVTVDERDAALIRSSSAMRRYDAIVEVKGGGLPTRDEPTHPCGFAYWPWQMTCPRCGDPITVGGFLSE